MFNYPNGIPTVEFAVYDGLRDTVGHMDPMVPSSNQYFKVQADAIAEEVRQILARELTVLIDQEHVATEWNDAIYQAIRLVEGTLP